MRTEYTTFNHAQLEARARALVRRLGGVWSRSGGMCLCPAHDDRSPSLSIRVGHSDLLFKCFAGCDTINVLRAIGRRGDQRPPSVAARGLRYGIDDAWLRSRVMDLWAEARAMIGTPAEHYLRNRAIAHFSPELRYHPRTPLGPLRRGLFRPALLAAVRDGPALLAVQRTFLDINCARQARDLGNPCRMLGSPAAGAVKLADATDVLCLAEGVETALSAMILLAIPVWAALGSARLPRIAIPSSVERLILLPDNDQPGWRAEAVARETYAQPGRTIETILPWHGLNDWNDVLLREGRSVGGICGRRPDGQTSAALGE